MRGLLLLCATLLHLQQHVSPVAALHESDVGVVDWHKPLIGLPNFHAPWTLPLFHRVRNHSEATTSSLVITATKANVLAALDPENGKVGTSSSFRPNSTELTATAAWRHQYPASDPILSFSTHLAQNRLAAQSGPGGSTVRVYTSTLGQLICDVQLHPPREGRLSEPAWIGSAQAFELATKNLYVLTNGNTVTKLGPDCNVLWTWKNPAER